MAIDANPASPDMNAYCDVAYADAYFTFRFGADAWTDDTLSDAQKEALIVSSTNELENFMYGGSKTAASQPLQWPRKSLYDLNGDPIPSDVLPSKMKNATLEWAYWKWTEEERLLSDADVYQVDSVKYASALDITAKKGAPTIPPKVLSILNSIGQGVLLSTGNDGTSAQSMNMVL